MVVPPVRGVAVAEHSFKTMLSIIIPTLNEENNIARVINDIKSSIQLENYEIIICDGGSSDKTTFIAESLCDQVVISPAGRGGQLNHGAKNAHGDILLFLHADTSLPIHFDKMITNAIATNPGKSWGRFDLRLSGEKVIFRIVERLINIRSRITFISTGDQCLFMTREIFENVNGFKHIPLMEDVDISKRLKNVCPPICIACPVVSSSRRWEEKGILRTILLMWWLRLLFYMGISPETLKRLYN